MPKLVLLDRGENVLTQWMFDADKNDMGHLTLKEPVHLTGFIQQLQEALDQDEGSYVLTEQKPYPCDFCGRASIKQFCSHRCEGEMADFPLPRKIADDAKKEIVVEKCSECRFYKEATKFAVCTATMLNLPRKEPQWPPENCPMRTAPIIITMRLSRGLGPGA